MNITYPNEYAVGITSGAEDEDSITDKSWPDRSGDLIEYWEEGFSKGESILLRQNGFSPMEGVEIRALYAKDMVGENLIFNNWVEGQEPFEGILERYLEVKNTFDLFLRVIIPEDDRALIHKIVNKHLMSLRDKENSDERISK